MYVYVNDWIGLGLNAFLYYSLAMMHDYIISLVGIITARIQHLTAHMRKYKKVNPNQ